MAISKHKMVQHVLLVRQPGVFTHRFPQQIHQQPGEREATQRKIDQEGEKDRGKHPVEDQSKAIHKLTDKRPHPGFIKPGIMQANR